MKRFAVVVAAMLTWSVLFGGVASGQILNETPVQIRVVVNGALPSSTIIDVAINCENAAKLGSPATHTGKRVYVGTKGGQSSFSMPNEARCNVGAFALGARLELSVNGADPVTGTNNVWSRDAIQFDPNGFPFDRSDFVDLRDIVLVVSGPSITVRGSGHVSVSCQDAPPIGVVFPGPNRFSGSTVVTGERTFDGREFIGLRFGSFCLVVGPHGSASGHVGGVIVIPPAPPTSTTATTTTIQVAVLAVPVARVAAPTSTSTTLAPSPASTSTSTTLAPAVSVTTTKPARRCARYNFKRVCTRWVPIV